MNEDNYNDRGEQYLKLLNLWLNNQGYEPKYSSFEDMKSLMKLNAEKTYKKVKNAYNFFVLKSNEKTRGAKPELSTYGKKRSKQIRERKSDEQFDNFDNDELKGFKDSENIINKDNLNSDFLNNEMEEEKRDLQSLTNLFGGTGGKGKPKKFWNDKEWVGKHQAAFQNTFTKLSNPYEISYNPNYLRKDYFEYLKANNDKYEDWTRDDTQDLDGDGLNDIVISDKKGNWRYFNGYSLNPKGKDKYGNPITTRGLRQQYILTNPDDEGFKTGYIPYLHKLEGHTKVKVHKVYESLVNDFLKAIGNYYKKVAEKFNTHDKLIYQRSNYKGKLRSLINRYVVYPTILFALNGEPNAVRKIIFAEPKSDEMTTLRKIYQDKKDTIKNQLENNQELLNQIGEVIAEVQTKILADVKNSNPLPFLTNLINGETANIEKYFYNTVLQILNIN